MAKKNEVANATKGAQNAPKSENKNGAIATPQSENKIERKDARKGLSEGNKWVRSLVGATGVVKLGWGHGYQFAFKYYGVKASKDVTPETFESLIAEPLKGDDGTFMMWKKKYELTAKGAKKAEAGKALEKEDYKMKNGKRIFTWEKRKVASITPTSLWNLCEQSLNGGVMPTDKDVARTKAKKDAIRRNAEKKGNKNVLNDAA